MIFQFATCNRKTALEFLRKFYPSRTLEDEGKTKAVLDLVEADIIRIPDPEYHNGKIFLSQNCDESKKEYYINILKDFDKAGE